MSDWHIEMERKVIKARKEAQANRKAAEEARQKRQREKQKARAARDLQKHRRKYTCYICGRPSDGPSYKHICYMIWGKETRDEVGHYDWSDPAGLSLCSICKKWACYDKPEDPHIHQGVCKRCYEKGYLPGDRRKWWDLLMLV